MSPERKGDLGKHLDSTDNQNGKPWRPCNLLFLTGMPRCHTLHTGSHVNNIIQCQNYTASDIRNTNLVRDGTQTVGKSNSMQVAFQGSDWDGER